MHCQKFICSAAVLDHKIHAPRTLTYNGSLHPPSLSWDIDLIWIYWRKWLGEQRWLAGLCRTTVVNTTYRTDKYGTRKKRNKFPANSVILEYSISNYSTELAFIGWCNYRIWRRIIWPTRAGLPDSWLTSLTFGIFCWKNRSGGDGGERYSFHRPHLIIMATSLHPPTVCYQLHKIRSVTLERIPTYRHPWDPTAYTHCTVSGCQTKYTSSAY